VRIPLTYKFVLGSLIVAGASIALPEFLRIRGLQFPAWGSLFIAMGVGGVIGFALSRVLGQKFERLLEMTEQIRGGDLRLDPRRADRMRLPDETNDLDQSLRAMLANLRDMVSSVQRTGAKVTTAARDLTGSIHNVRSGNEGISATVEEIARSVETEQEMLGNAARLIQEIASEIDLNAGRAREAFGFAAEANQKAGIGVEVARLAIEKMRTVFERVEQAGGKVFDLESKTRDVYQITEIITSVAHRTNLLSLNASIEAARAGEAGRGFSVVADEIRKLSENVGRSADEISKLIHEIQSDTGEVADEMRESSQVIGEGREDVNTIAASLEQISMAVSEAAARSEEIFHGADTQSRSTERMVSSMDEISKVARGNAVAIEDVSRTARSQLEAVTSTLGSSEALTNLADALRSSLGTFRTDEARASAGAAPRDVPGDGPGDAAGDGARDTVPGVEA
jgi:methyl-accepting chemotaxis protein